MNRVVTPRRLRLLLAALFAMVMTVTAAGTASATPTLTLYGPDAETAVSANYTYTSSFGAFYVTFVWDTRNCPTASVSDCTASWLFTRTAYYEVNAMDNYTTRLNRDCTGGGTKTFQVRVTASGFAAPAQTAYKVTKLCNDLL